MKKDQLTRYLAGYLSTKKPFENSHPLELMDLAKDVLRFLDSVQRNLEG